MPRQRQDVFRPLAQRRHEERQHAQPVIQVAAERPVQHEIFDARVRRRDDARAERERRVAAEPLDALFLDDPQQLALRVERQLGDRVEIHGAGARRLETARPRGDRVGEGAALVAEELRVDQRSGQRGAVHRHERRLRARAARVQLARHGVLAGAGLAGDEDVGIGAREAPHLFGERAHHATVREKALAGHGYRPAASSMRSALPHSRSRP
jgi:hypothetical protein